jgi:formylglycine-generating enzyme required for sulfatase activity
MRQWMGRVVRFGAVFVVAIGGAVGCYLGPDACDSFSEDYTECHGSRVVACTSSDDATDGYDWTEVRDCSKVQGTTCSGGECKPAPSTEPCPAASLSVCRGEEIRDCIDGMVAQVGTRCRYGQFCTETADEVGRHFAQCALDQVVCPNAAETSWDCRDGELFECRYGRTLTRFECPNSAACVVERGVSSCPESAPLQTELRWQSVPSGSFNPGSPDTRLPNPGVPMDGFQMMEREVTVAAYQRCIDANVCMPVPDHGVDGDVEPSGGTPDVLPVTGITKDQARRFCWHVGGRLPRAWEWEYAMRNAGRDVTYPWGTAALDCRAAVVALPPSDGAACPSSGPQPGCTREADVTEQGICDLVGNVAEITEGGVQGGDFMTTDPTHIYYPGRSVSPGQLGFRCIRDEPNSG